MSIVRRQLDELNKMQKFVAENEVLLEPEEAEELKKYIADQARQCELYCKLEDMAANKTKETKEPEKPAKKASTKSKAKTKAQAEIKEYPVKEDPVEQEDLFADTEPDDFADLLG